MYATFFALLFITSLLHVVVSEVVGSTINVKYPMQSFTTRTDWRNSVKYSEMLVNKVIDPQNHHAQDDIVIYEKYFYGITQGVVVESGGFNGLMDSFSWFYEQHADWQAILVEADLDNYHQLKSNRPLGINVNCALCDVPATLHYVPNKKTTGGIWEFMSPNYASVWHKALFDSPTLVSQLPEVQCVRYDALLINMGVTRVDLWILDVEGAEEAVLKGVDLNKVRVNVIYMEFDHSDREKDNRKRGIIEGYGYHCEETVLKKDLICVHPEFKPSTKPSSDSTAVAAARATEKHAQLRRKV